ncbi:MAG: hypothetical protein LBV04_08435 [Deferribacteraceae bacterium]|jgi:hypothetical protein|nr:hypothetical protein [Deferribacteraceae bacterium]
MTKVDFLFYAFGIFCYFSIIFEMKSQQLKVEQYNELQKKKEIYASRMIEQKRQDALAKATEERKAKNKVDLRSMTSTMEKLSAMSDQEIMRKSKVTSGK